MHSISNSASPHREFAGEFFELRSRSAALSNDAHLVGSEAGRGRALSVGDTILGGAVSHVIPVVAKEQMVGSHALSVVAAMADMKPLGDGAVCQFVSIAMRENGVVPGKSEAPVAIDLADMGLPFPAVSGAINLRPEAVCGGNTRSLGQGLTVAVAGAKAAVPTPDVREERFEVYSALLAIFGDSLRHKLLTVR